MILCVLCVIYRNDNFISVNTTESQNLSRSKLLDCHEEGLKVCLYGGWRAYVMRFYFILFYCFGWILSFLIRLLNNVKASGLQHLSYSILKTQEISIFEKLESIFGFRAPSLVSYICN